MDEAAAFDAPAVYEELRTDIIIIIMGDGITIMNSHAWDAVMEEWEMLEEEYGRKVLPGVVARDVLNSFNGTLSLPFRSGE